MFIKKIFILLLVMLTSIVGYGQSEVIISQYIETNSGSTPKGVEIFNVSGSDIIFSASNNLQVYQGTNGGSCSVISAININSGTLAADEVWVIGTSDLTSYATTNGSNLSGVEPYSFTFNGDDALQIYLGGVLQDQFGICGSDPGSSWSSGGVNTSNNNLQIKDAICDGDTDGWTDPSIRFDEIAVGTIMTGFGDSPASCFSSNPTITVSPATITGLDYSEDLGPSVAQTFTVEGSNLTDDIDVTAPINFEISLDNIDFSVNPITLTQSGGTVASTTIYVRLASGLSNGTYGASTITAVSTLDAVTENISVTGDVVQPLITLSPVTLTGLDYVDGSGPSAEQTFTVSGTNLSDDITLTAPTNFQISETSGSGFGTTVTLSPTSETVASTTIYVRLISGLAVGTYGASNIAASSNLGTTQNVAVSGEVTGLCTAPSSQSNSLILTSVTSSSFNGSFTATTADGYLVVYSTNSSLSSNPVDGTSYSNGDPLGGGIVAQSSSSTSFSLSSLSQSTTYYVFVFAYNNSGCSGGPAYNTTSPLIGDETTLFGPCLSDDFDSGYGNWSDGSGTYTNTTAGVSGNGVGFNNTGDEIITSFPITDPQSITFWLASSSTSSNKTLSIQYSTSSSGPWTSVRDILNGEVTTTHQEFTISLNLTGDYYLNIEMTQRTGGSYYLDDVDVYCGTVLATPTIITNIDTISGLNYAVGSGPSAEQIFTVEGTDLTDDILINAPANFQISTTLGGPYSSSITLTQSGGSVSTTTIYVIMISGLAENTYTGNIDLTSTGATAKVVDLNGEVTCISTHTISSFSPTSGPVETEVIINGTGFTTATTVDFNGEAAIVTFVDSTTLIAEVPSAASTGVITVYNGTCGVATSTDFEVIVDNGCVGGTMPAGFTDLMFSGVYDDETDSCHYIELLNPTSSAIDLSNYTLGFDNNFTYPSAVPITGFNGLVSLSGIIAAESTFMLQVTTISGGCTSCPTISPDQTIVAGIGLNVDDRLVLVEDYGTGSATAIDVWQNHSSELVDTDYGVGYVFARDFGASAPSSTFSLSDWSYDGFEDCFGFAIASTPLPTVDTHPIDVTGCSTISFSVSATAGNSGTLSYQWYYNDGVSAGWTSIISSSFSPGTVTGETSDILTITGVALDGYQFYCEVTEAGTCAVYSNAAQVSVESKVWDGTSWDGDTLPPTLNSTVTLNGDYNTTLDGDLLACSLTVNATYTLSVEDNSFVQVQNNVLVEGNVIVETHGSFVQIDDTSTFTVSGSGASSVNKTTSFLNHWYDYTHWSSPVEDDTVCLVLKYGYRLN